MIRNKQINKLQRLKSDELDIAIMPIWNSSIGFVTNPEGVPYFKHILEQNTYQFLSEEFFPVKFCLLVHPGTDPNSITTLHINPYGKSLCKNFLALHGNWIIEEHSSSSEAAKATMMAGRQHAALAGSSAAIKYGLEIGKHDVSKSFMHFVSLTKNITNNLSHTSEKIISSFGFNTTGLKKQQIEKLHTDIQDIFPQALIRSTSEFFLVDVTTISADEINNTPCRDSCLKRT
jgi:prephenate dehydratase